MDICSKCYFSAFCLKVGSISKKRKQLHYEWALAPHQWLTFPVKTYSNFLTFTIETKHPHLRCRASKLSQQIRRPRLEIPNLDRNSILCQEKSQLVFWFCQVTSFEGEVWAFFSKLRGMTKCFKKKIWEPLHWKTSNFDTSCLYQHARHNQNEIESEKSVIWSLYRCDISFHNV